VRHNTRDWGADAALVVVDEIGMVGGWIWASYGVDRISWFGKR
jgi:hypothetical protein